MHDVAIQLLNGLFVGLTLALVAAGLALVFGVLGVVNFAQGELVMLGGYVVFSVVQLTHSFALGVIVATLGVGLGGGLVLYALLRPLEGRSAVLPMLATLGLSVLLRQLAQVVFGGFIRTVAQPVTATVPFEGVQYPIYDLIISLVSAAALAGGYVFLKAARFGIWLRAAADNRGMAAALGVPLPRVYVVAFVLSAGLSALAGAMLAPITAVYVNLGQDVAASAFIVVVAGGMGNFRGAAVFALILGEIEALGSIWFRPVLVQVFALLLVIAMLVLRSRARATAWQPTLSGWTDRAAAGTGVPWPLAAAVLLALGLAPALLGATASQQALPVLVQALLACAVATLVRFGGVVNLGMGAVFGASAYLVANLSQSPSTPAWLVLGGGLLAGVAVAVIFGLYANVASGIEYMMLTFLTTLAAAQLPNALPFLSGGENGLQVRDVAAVAFGIEPLAGRGFYVLALALAASMLAVVWFVLASHVGRVALAAGRNPLRVAALGYELRRLRLLVALLVGIIAGLAGWIDVLQARHVGQDVLGLEISLGALADALVGGIAQPILGSAIGAAVFGGLNQLLGRLGPRSPLYAGLALLVVVYVLPTGLLGLWRRLTVARAPGSRPLRSAGN